MTTVLGFRLSASVSEWSWPSYQIRRTSMPRQIFYIKLFYTKLALTRSEWSSSLRPKQAVTFSTFRPENQHARICHIGKDDSIILFHWPKRTEIEWMKFSVHSTITENQCQSQMRTYINKKTKWNPFDADLEKNFLWSIWKLNKKESS